MLIIRLAAIQAVARTHHWPRDSAPHLVLNTLHVRYSFIKNRRSAEPLSLGRSGRGVCIQRGQAASKAAFGWQTASPIPFDSLSLPPSLRWHIGHMMGVTRGISSPAPGLLSKGAQAPYHHSLILSLSSPSCPLPLSLLLWNPCEGRRRMSVRGEKYKPPRCVSSQIQGQGPLQAEEKDSKHFCRWQAGDSLLQVVQAERLVGKRAPTESNRLHG
jgi:hypothetical protein